nr:TAXI family TRAP transporter solute-binding subunit [uncultured Desulfobulbus sp.]
MKKIIFFILTLLVSTHYAHANAYIFIGAGPIAGDTYLVAGSLAKTLNSKRKEFHFRASVQSTHGDTETIRLLKSGDIDFGVVSTRHLAAHNQVRVIFSLPTTPYVVVTSEKAAVGRVHTFVRAVVENLTFLKIQLCRVNILQPRADELLVGGGLVEDAVFTKESMLTGFSGRLHPGSLKYFKEAGIQPKTLTNRS